MRRVAYVCADPGLPVFGTKGCSIHLRELVRAMSGLGAEVTVFARRLGDGDPRQLPGVRVVRLPSLPRGATLLRERAALAANASTQAALRAAGPFDLVVERYALWSYAGMEYARKSGVPGLLEVNAPLIEEQERYRELVDAAAARAASARAMNTATWLMPVSEELACHLRGSVPEPRKVVVVPNGVDPARFPRDLEPSRPAGPGVFTVAFVGTLRPWHGVTTLVDAFALLRRCAPRSRLLVIGDGPERRSMVERLAACEALEAAELVGAVPHAEVPALLASADAAVAPYPTLENFYFSPLKLYEYMAARLPVVASDIGQLRELIRSGENGLLTPAGDARQLAGALAVLRADPQLRRRLGEAGRATIEAGRTWSDVAGRVLALGAPRTEEAVA